MSPERLFTLLELAVVQRVIFLAGREACAGSVQAKNAANSAAVDAE